MKRKCSMCGEYMQIDNFRFMRSQNRHNSYCRECERWYQKHYHRTYRARKKRWTRNARNIANTYRAFTASKRVLPARWAGGKI